MNVLIVDDERLARTIIRNYLTQLNQEDVIHEADSTEEAERILNSHVIDLMFLDIEMPEETGIEFLLRVQPDTQVIFATAFNEYAIQAFELNAIDYLLKPFDIDRFKHALQKAMHYSQHQLTEIYNALRTLNDDTYIERIIVKDRDRLNIIKTHDLIAIEAQGDYSLLSTKDDRILHLITLNELESKLNPKSFIRIHRSTIINANEIIEISILSSTKMKAKMTNGKSYDISRSGQQRIKNLN